jgi:hypothetical protein
MYEWRPRLRGNTPAASTGGASPSLGTNSRGRRGNRQRQRSRAGSFSGSPVTSTTAKMFCQPDA